ncbi:MAG: ABC transporter permease subunit [Oligoflexales bacterium]|nr:ABC transporter permease subunit [Oligoflexales bacterium]
MWHYLFKRLLLIFPTLFGIITICFLFTQIVPGGPVEQAISQLKQADFRGEVTVSNKSGKDDSAMDMEEQKERFRKLYGLDKPIHIQYFNWLKRLATFDFGESFYYNKKITDLIVEKLPVSASLGITSMIVTYLITIPLGIKKAIRHGTTFDVVTSVIVLLAYSIPPLIMGVFLIIFFCGGSFFNWFPIRGLTSDNFASLTLIQQTRDVIWHLVLPVIAYTMTGFAWLTMLTKNLFLNEINQQYVITARAKGLPEKIVLFKHIFRNAMIFVISGIPSVLVFMFFGGSLFVETIFSLDGLGLLSYQSVIRRDYAFVLSNIYIFSLLSLLTTVFSDIILSLVDPRITFAEVPD